VDKSDAQASCEPRIDPASQMNTVLRRVGVNAGWLLAGRGFQAVLSIAYLALATRSLGLVEFGKFTLVVAVAQGISALVGFQTWQFVVRYGSRALAAKDEDGLARVIGVSAMLDFIAASFGCLVSLAAIALGGRMLGLAVELHAAAFGFCFAMLIAVRSTPTGVLRLDQRFRDAALADSALPAIRALGALAAALCMPTVAGFLWAWAAAEVVTALATWHTAMRQRKLSLAPAELRRFMRDEPGFWRFVLMTNLSSTLTMTSKHFTLIIIGALSGPAAAGLFRVAAQLAQALAKATQTFSRVAYSELVQAGNEGSDRALLIQLTAVAGVAACLMVAVAALFGEPLLHLIATRQFSGAYLPVVILVAAAGLDLLGFAFEPAMTARGDTEAAFWLRFIATGILLVLLVILLPAFGVVGGAWATFGGSLTALVLTGWGVSRAMPLAPVHSEPSTSQAPL
jgi:O-antigen/teichoic acid export membrane protein